MKLRTHRPCVSIVVMNPEGKILLVHKPRKRDAWQFPQGGIEASESLEETAKRELREETGIALGSPLTVSRYHYQYDYPPGFIRAKKPRFAGQHLTFVTASVPPGTIVKVDQRELDAFRWVTPHDLGRYLKRKKYLEVVRNVIEEAGTYNLKPIS